MYFRYKKLNILILFLILFLFLTFNPIEVKADNYSADEYVFREVIDNGYDSETDTYSFDYRVYISSGLCEGTVYIPSSIYNYENWALWINGGVPNLLVSTSGSSFLYVRKYQNETRLVFDSFGNVYLKNFRYYVYDNSTNTWTLSSSGSQSVFRTSFSNIQPNSIIYKKNMYINYSLSSDNTLSDTLMRINPHLARTNLRLTNDSIRFYLGDFHGATYELDTVTEIRNLISILFTVRDLNTSENIIGYENLLSYRDIEQDENGNYYIDVLFGNYLNSLQVGNGDYLISVCPILRISDHYNIFGDSTFFDMTTLYETFDFYRYQYYESSGTGLLVPVDAELNPINSSPVIDEPIEENENDNTVNAINELNSSIEEQTNAIVESIGVQRNIFQQIVDLPNTIISGFLNMLKSIFIPSDDFFSDFFSDLFDWFTDRLGFLSYPLELIVNILNRILNINFAEPILEIPNIYEPITNELLIHETSFNFNSLLENETLKTVHDIYLIIIDAGIIFGLVNLAKSKFEEVTSK